MRPIATAMPWPWQVVRTLARAHRLFGGRSAPAVQSYQ